MQAVAPPVPNHSARLIWIGAAVVCAFLVHLGLGSTNFVDPVRVVQELLRGPMADPSRENAVVWSIRLVRSCGCLLVGGLLGVVGSALQALFRNPLADPYIVGVSSGAAVGAVISIVFGFAGALGGLGQLSMAFVTGLASLGIVYAVAQRRGAVDVGTLLLAGVVVGALLSALTSYTLLHAGQDTNRVLRWLLGSTSEFTWAHNAVLAPILAVGSAILILQSRNLNAFAVGEEAALRLGVDARRLKGTVLVVGTAMTAASVGAAGIVGFLGLVSPHLARRLLGVDWRVGLIGSLMLGSSLLLVADAIAQRAGSELTELPVGIVTSLIGAPFLLVLLKKQG